MIKALSLCISIFLYQAFVDPRHRQGMLTKHFILRNIIAM